MPSEANRSEQMYAATYVGTYVYMHLPTYLSVDLSMPLSGQPTHPCACVSPVDGIAQQRSRALPRGRVRVCH